MDLKQIKAVLRAGKWTSPGCYPLFFITRCGAALSFEAVREEWRNVCWDHIWDASTGWRIEGVEINYEDPALYCEQTGERIESAYMEHEANEG